MSGFGITRNLYQDKVEKTEKEIKKLTNRKKPNLRDICRGS